MKSLIRAFIMTAGVIGTMTTSLLADPWKDESGKFHERYKEWNKDRDEDFREWQKDRREAAREWEKDRREAAREWDKAQRDRWRERRGVYYTSEPNVYYENHGPFPPPSQYGYAPYRPPDETHYRWQRFDDDDFYYDDNQWRHGEHRFRQPYHGEVYEPHDGYYYNRGGDIGARIGSRIGRAIGGSEGAVIGADIGAAIGSEVDD